MSWNNIFTENSKLVFLQEIVFYRRNLFPQNAICRVFSALSSSQMKFMNDVRPNWMIPNADKWKMLGKNSLHKNLRRLEYLICHRERRRKQFFFYFLLIVKCHFFAEWRVFIAKFFSSKICISLSLRLRCRDLHIRLCVVCPFVCNPTLVPLPHTISICVFSIAVWKSLKRLTNSKIAFQKRIWKR